MSVAESLIRLTPFGEHCGLRITLTTAIPPFNLGLNVNDCEQEVIARRKSLSDHLGSKVIFIRQVHGVKVVDAAQAHCLTHELEADAIASASPLYSPAILTADCLPVVIAAFEQERAVAVCVAHAGWRGLCGGVITEAVNALAKYTNAREPLRAWLGPCIGPASFKVGVEVKLAFEAEWGEVGYAFRKHKAVNKYLADLQVLAYRQLTELNVLTAGRIQEDTFTNRRWYSHRAFQQSGAPVGRFATVAQLLP